MAIECTVEDPDHPGPTTMNVQVFSQGGEAGITLTFEKISSLEWRSNNAIKL